MTNKMDYVELGLTCADICTALGRGMNRTRLDDLSQSVREAIAQLTTCVKPVVRGLEQLTDKVHDCRTVAEIQKRVIKLSRRNPVSRLFHAKNDKEMVAAWKSDLNRILHVFNVCPAISVLPPLTVHPQTELSMNTHVVVTDIRQDVVNTRTILSDVHQGVVNTHSIATDTHTIVSDIHRAMVVTQEGADGKDRLVSVTCIRCCRINTHRYLDSEQVSATEYWWIRHLISIPMSSTPGETPPPPPRACFGRDKLIEKIVDLAEDLTPVALIGPGGIGKTSVALTVLHHDRIKRRFGDNRRFIRCDQFPASRSHFLSQLSKVIGAGVDNPEDLAPLRPFLSSRKMIIILDNAESILDPEGTNAREIYAVAEELSRFGNICLCVTSRISTIPATCKTLDVPTLSVEAARNTFHDIYENGSGHPDQFNGILEQLDFHPLSITLLATVAHHSKWDANRLTSEWGRRRIDVLHTRHDDSLAATIELSLGSPMFRELGPDARELLGVVAFFPRGVNENNLDWLFPTLSDRTNTFDNLCILSLTYRSNGFITMLAPLRDYLRPKDPNSSPLLLATKDHYLSRLSVDLYPGKPGFEEARWIASEDVNVEHLLDIFTSIDPSSGGIWAACAHFMEHLSWHKNRLVMLGPKIEALPDDHHSKAYCLFELSRLFDSVGNQVECKRLLTHASRLWTDRGDDCQVARSLTNLSDTNRLLNFHAEGIEQAKEALEIYERLDYVPGQIQSRRKLAWLLYDDGQLDAAEQVVSKAIDALSDEDDKFELYGCHRLLGNIFSSKGETEKAIDHFQKAISIGTASDFHDQMFWIHYDLAQLFFDGNRFDDAHAYIERAKSLATNHPYKLGRAMEQHARFWCEQHKLEEGRGEALRAADVYKKIGAMSDVEDCQAILRNIEKAMRQPAASP